MASSFGQDLVSASFSFFRFAEVVTERLDDVLRVLDVFHVLERRRSTVHVVLDFSSARSTSRITM